MRTILALLLLASSASAADPVAMADGQSVTLQLMAPHPVQHGRPAWTITWPDGRYSGYAGCVWVRTGYGPTEVGAWRITMYTATERGDKWIRSSAQNPPSGLHLVGPGLTLWIP